MPREGGLCLRRYTRKGHQRRTRLRCCHSDQKTVLAPCEWVSLRWIQTSLPLVYKTQGLLFCHGSSSPTASKNRTNKLCKSWEIRSENFDRKIAAWFFWWEKSQVRKKNYTWMYHRHLAQLIKKCFVCSLQPSSYGVRLRIRSYISVKVAWGNSRVQLQLFECLANLTNAFITRWLHAAR